MSHRSANGGRRTAAHVRIRVFSGVIGALGILAAVWIGFAVLPDQPQTSSGPRVVTQDDYYFPWENPDPVIAAQEGEVWSGAGQAVIELEGLDPSIPLHVEQIDAFEAGTPYLELHLTGPNAGALPDSEQPVEIDLISEPYYVIPGAENVELWVSSSDIEPWQLRISVADDIDVRGGTVSGLGSGVFLYTGNASSARVSARGSTSLRIEQVVPTGREHIFDTHEARDRTIAWPDSVSSVFIVEAYGSETPWTIQFFETTESADAEAAEEEQSTVGVHTNE